MNRVCHLETRVLQARSHGQACSREHMHIQLKWYITPHALTPPNTNAFLPKRAGPRSQHRSWTRDLQLVSCSMSPTLKTSKTKTPGTLSKLTQSSVVYEVIKRRHQSRYGSTTSSNLATFLGERLLDKRWVSTNGSRRTERVFSF